MTNEAALPLTATALAEMAASRRHALFFDLDGTLLDFSDTPYDIVIPADLKAALAALYEASGGALAFNTGRDEVFIEAHFSDFRVPASVQHGVMIRLRQDEDFRAHHPVPPFELYQAELEAVCAQVPGSFLESNKAYARSYNWRGSALTHEQGLEIFSRFAAAFAERHNAATEDPDRHLGLTVGNMAVEIGPRGADKGFGVMRLMEQAPFKGRSPVFFGDTFADLPGFEAARRYGGMGVAVGMQISQHGDMTVESPDAMRRMLIGAAEVLRES